MPTKGINMDGYFQDKPNMNIKEESEPSSCFKEPGEHLLSMVHSAPSDEQTSQSSCSPVSSPDASGCISSPGIYSEDSQMSLIHRSEALNIMDEMSHLSSDDVLCWPNTVSNGFYSLEERNSETRAKIRKNEDDSDVSNATFVSPAVSTSGYDLTNAITSSEFIFTQFGKESSPVFATEPKTSTGGNSSTTTSDTVSLRSSPMVQQPTSKKSNEPSLNLNQSFPNKHGKYELEILVQPENHHRARYLTEGSRGAVKDQSGEGHPMIKLNGFNEKCLLQVFVGQDTGKPKPHGFYQACKVSGKNSTNCSERDAEGITVIAMDILPEDDMIARIDCVGILKLRNADVEHMIGVTGKSKKKSTKARLVFRVSIPKPDGSYVTLQSSSIPILCTQPVGTPEICRQSLTECPVTGERDLFIIGKNFGKGIKVIFREKQEDSVTWQEQSPVETDFFQTTHLICRVPKYKSQLVTHPVCVELVLHCAGKFSEPSNFTYTPVMIEPKQEVTSPPAILSADDRILQEFKSSAVSPEALALNRLIQEQACSTASTTTIFQIPEGVGIYTSQSSNLDNTTSVTCSDGHGFPVLTDQKVPSSFLPNPVAPMNDHPAAVSSTQNPNKTFLLDTSSYIDETSNASYGLPSDVTSTSPYGIPPDATSPVSYGLPSDATSTISYGLPSDATSTVSYGLPSDATSTVSYGLPSDAPSTVSYGLPSDAISTVSYGLPSDATSTVSYGLPSDATSTVSYGLPSDAVSTTSYALSSDVLMESSMNQVVTSQQFMLENSVSSVPMNVDAHVCNDTSKAMLENHIAMETPVTQSKPFMMENHVDMAETSVSEGKPFMMENGVHVVDNNVHMGAQSTQSLLQTLPAISLEDVNAILLSQNVNL